jgi:hypothetical protein
MGYSIGMTVDERIEALVARHEALTARHEALTMHVEIITRDIEKLGENSERDAENIRALARIAELHERRLTDIEGGPSR